MSPAEAIALIRRARSVPVSDGVLDAAKAALAQRRAVAKAKSLARRVALAA
jgi:hypothetical protein